jgi:heme/copper-type cytochrome/quinol oxidase subunit 2
MDNNYRRAGSSLEEEKKYFIGYRVGIAIFIVLIVSAVVLYVSFFLLQNKKDREFQDYRPKIEGFKNNLQINSSDNDDSNDEGNKIN